jgi:hypothetical protein
LSDFGVFDSFLDDTLALAKPVGIAMNSLLFLEYFPDATVL